MSRINYWKIMTRRKPLPAQECEESKMGRVFGTFDLTALGVSATLGVGVYVLAGHVAKDQAGPSVILSFLIAAFASFLAGLCYAEFSSRIPKSGSAYIFTYVAIGEFLAFIVGWNLILEYVIGAASISKGLSLYIDSLMDDKMKNAFIQIAPISWDFLSSYFDFFAFGCPLVIGLALAFGLRKSAGVNNIFCMLNLGVVAYVVVAVIFNADVKNWQIDPKDIPAQYANTTGVGGFFPFGFSGTLKGAATCFFGFVGFDCIATTGEEVRNPQKTVPRALLFSLLIIFLAYFGVSLLTLMYPYYLLNSEAPLPHAFQEIGWISSKWVVTVGGIIGLLASLFGALFPLPRILYAMAQDGLIFREFGVISSRFKTPVTGTLCAAFLTSSFASLLNLTALVSMLSIGVLLAYTVVAISIIILRFSQSTEPSKLNSEHYIETSNLLRPGYNITAKGFVMQMFRFNSPRYPNVISMWVVSCLIGCYCLMSFALAFTILNLWDEIARGETWVLVTVLLLAAFLLMFCILISIQPRQKFPGHTKPFKVPAVPFLPAISVFINIYLMLMLDYYTWIRFGIWMVLGFIVYIACACLYGMKENDPIQIADEIVSNSNNNAVVKTSTSSEETKRSSTCEEDVTKIDNENVIIINESRQLSTCPEPANDLNDENETYLAIEMLDTVLEAEEAMEVYVRKDSIRSNDGNMPEILSKQISYAEKETSEENSLNETKNYEIFDSESLLELENEIEDIIAKAQEYVESRKSQDFYNEDEEKSYKSKEFLMHLNKVIAKSFNLVKVDEIPKQTKTLERKHENNKQLSMKHSKSTPNLSNLIDDNLKGDATLFNFNTEDKSESNPSVPPPPVFNLELFEKIATLKYEKKEAEAEPLPQTFNENPPIVDSNEEDPVDTENFRDKLEKLLRVPPARINLVTPIPMPRTGLKDNLNTKHDTQEQQMSSTKPQTIGPAQLKQRKLFDEVLKNLQKT